jgi:hypothetical protein
MRLVVSSLAALALLAGCGGGSDGTGSVASDATSSAPSIDVPTDSPRFASIDELRDAAVAVGYACPMWKQNNAVGLALESGNCSHQDVLMIFDTQTELEKQVELYRENKVEHDELFEGQDLTFNPTLVGANWMIHGDGAVAVAEELRGTILRHEPAAGLDTTA